MNRPGLASLLVLAFLLASCAGAPTNHERLAAARAALQAGRIEEARATADAVHRASPDDPEAMRVLAAVHRQMATQSASGGEFEEARDHFVRAAQLEPGREARARDWLGAWEHGRDAGADAAQLVEYLLASLEANPADIEVRRTTAATLDELGRQADAVVHYLWVWEADRADIPVGLRLGSLYLALGQPDDARAVFERIVERDPKNLPAQLQLADIHEQQGRNDGAHDVYRALAAAHPDNPMVLFRYAAFLERTGALEKAEELRVKARDQMPGVERREMRKLRRRR